MTLTEGVSSGDRRALARAITLVESTRPDHRQEALALLDTVLPATGTAARVGVSGPPGVGKSLFIETLGLHLVEADHAVAVLAIDPSSARTGGSILGDKTRMSELARHTRAFIRPSPSRGDLGGVARRTREAMLLCEAAGFDVVIIETVGVGQSEIAVADLADTFVLLVAAGGGDELQGVKRGIMELADVVAVTKADGDLRTIAERTAADHQHAVRFLRHRHAGWEPRVLTTSALTGAGIDDVWRSVCDHRSHLAGSGQLDEQRRTQNRAWLWAELTGQLADALNASPAVADELPAVEADVAAGRVSPARAAARLLDAFTQSRSMPQSPR
ncbi:MAG: methylmalonyl Co-A mutase-associated GTPase MeaB [Acidimicrobiales bacterium]